MRALSRAEQFPDRPYLVFDTRNKSGYEGVFPTEDAAQAFIAAHPEGRYLDYGTPRLIEQINPSGPEPPEVTLQRLREGLAAPPTNENRAVGAVSQFAKVIPKDEVKPVDVTRMNAYSLNLSPEEVMAAIRPKMPSDEVFDAAAMAVRSVGELAELQSFLIEFAL